MSYKRLSPEEFKLQDKELVEAQKKGEISWNVFQHLQDGLYMNNYPWEEVDQSGNIYGSVIVVGKIAPCPHCNKNIGTKFFVGVNSRDLLDSSVCKAPEDITDDFLRGFCFVSKDQVMKLENYEAELKKKKEAKTDG